MGLWDSFTAAVDAGEPVELLVDTDANGTTDHFVTAIGYDDTPGALRYAAPIDAALRIQHLTRTAKQETAGLGSSTRGTLTLGSSAKIITTYRIKHLATTVG